MELIHIVSSVLTLSVLLLAALQAMLLFYRDRALRRGHTLPYLAGLPDLESMEKLLFRSIFFGFLLLTGIIISSFYFFFQWRMSFFLKLSVSLLAWLLFAVLLWCRHQYGLRGRVPIITTLLGTSMLLGIYIGSFVWSMS
ncbi:MAG: cytochrome c biogenesis protein CcsA [Gammaproteobacteria bacterium]|nr:cytochrome c biogenesis protein CcsA [Gammaproteobacteria bacterium]